ncbi:4-(cytidine 5'-diphospho)-2-C-methyl-D-erythritol kinase [Shewanella sp. NIFS-20-20]|uniref:4-(cytidine 5'-diphospho)-2-C-methyl-D-erythritol kinase n=1 Tax=Shewanella sp. NIFS-20-20 TaxID=2853806 RepID=UPI001C4653F2|nr:4-(cytidine 5'-diphospho)-2-C-methyl-D-erythritol kinase [Shewanella sp. NIFS-20-20]MBV7315896.1 4-(cytidine 5'-diphospho)-2-C-methyl-D-erythritol kinase [Shewanella sp. NIFS-20-20]
MTVSAISTRWPAPAKLNLFLHVNHQRADGYHELQTLFQFIDVCDYLTFAIDDSDCVTLDSELNQVVADSDNLILKAAKSLKLATGYKGGAHITLEKNIPMGGGLGGGSSDAATTLVALNALWKTGLSKQELGAIGLTLGADVPVFINGYAAFAEGVGEQLQAVTPAEPWYLIIAPDVHVATAAVFQDPELPRNTPKMQLDTLMSSPWRNDCEMLVARRHPQVANALGWLLEYAPSRMTGTGACVFGEFEQQSSAQAALDKMPSHWRGFVAKGKNISPLEQTLLSL